ncbi:MAG: hypothetical protein IBX44_06620 [Sulfurospirillum sp.]|nr:hypothetical protein [Sulfurospirillum sp.]
MKIDNIVSICGGELLNSPSITSVQEMKTDPLVIRHGDLFIDHNNCLEAVELAVQKGAYAILSSSIHKQLDNEIAWLHVSDISLALLKLSRYETTRKKLQFVAMSPVQIALLNELNHTPKIKILPNDPIAVFNELAKAPSEILFAGSCKEYLTQLDPHTLHVQHNITPSYMLAKGLFSCSFSYKERLYEDNKICAFYVPALLGLLDFLDTLPCVYTLESFLLFDLFSVQFVDQNFCKKEFGQSTQALIFIDNADTLTQLATFIQSQDLHVSILVLHKRDKNLIDQFFKCFTNTFRYTLIEGKKEQYEQYFRTNKQIQTSLF